MDELRELGVDVWFNLGDRDLAIGLRRAARLPRGRDAHRARSRELGAALGVRRARPADGRRRRCARASSRRGRVGRLPGVHDPRARQGPVDGVEYAGVEAATAADRGARGDRGGARDRVGPSNPVISIRPILAVPGMAEALRAAPAPVVGSRPSSAARSSRARPRRSWHGRAAAERGRGRRRLRRPARRHGRDEPAPAAPSLAPTRS